jgi:hypothetical protein
MNDNEIKKKKKKKKELSNQKKLEKMSKSLKKLIPVGHKLCNTLKKPPRKYKLIEGNIPSGSRITYITP